MRTAEQITKAVVAYMDPPLRAAAAQLTEPTRSIVEYYFGWVDSQGRPAAPFGVRRRAATLVLLAAGSNEASWRLARNAATAFNFMESASAIHDDIQDEDDCRNGRPSVWAAFGVPAAIQAGVAMVALSFELLTREPALIAAEAIRLNSLAARDICSGQILDVRAERNVCISLEESLANRAKNAAAPTACLPAVGALCRGASHSEREAAYAFGYHAGMALGLHDDWEATWGTNPLEEPMADIRQRKSLPYVAFALQASSSTARDEIIAYYSDTKLPDPDTLARITFLLEGCGARVWLEDQVRYHVRAAQQALIDAVPDLEAQAELVTYLSELIRQLG